MSRGTLGYLLFRCVIMLKMKKRDYKEFAKGEICHVFNRGNNKEKIFIDNDDYRAFLFRIALSLGLTKKDISLNDLLYFPKTRVRINSKAGLFKIHAFCLMPNHFHLLVEQLTDDPISSLILKLSTSFSMYFNRKYERIGNVFQDCFKSVNVKTNEQLMWNSTYIHMNPVTAGIVKTPIEYEWSSYRDVMKERDLPIVSLDLLPKIFGNKENLMQQTILAIKNKGLSEEIFD